MRNKELIRIYVGSLFKILTIIAAKHCLGKKKSFSKVRLVLTLFL